MAGSPKNIAASVRDRLRNLSQAKGEDFKFWLHRYAVERFLYRLGQSPHRNSFVLKGAMLFQLWGETVYRPTRDLDLTGYGSARSEDLLAAFENICDLLVAEDGLVFDMSAIRLEPIREETEYGGQRVRLAAVLGVSRIPLKVDVGFGNAIVPGAQDVLYPTLLAGPAPSVRAYPREAVVAEKLHAMVLLGERNTRLKDFYDLHALCTHFPFEGSTLSQAIAATFSRRRTTIASELPAALTPRFYADSLRADQWRAYLDRNRLPGVSSDFSLVGERLQLFLAPLWDSLALDRTVLQDSWRAPGPWSTEEVS